MMRSMKKQECEYTLLLKKTASHGGGRETMRGLVERKSSQGPARSVQDIQAQSGTVQSCGIFWVIYRDFAAQKLHVPMSHIHL